MQQASMLKEGNVMNRCSILAATAIALSVMLPSILSAAEVTPATPAATARSTQRPEVVNRLGWIGFAVSPNRRAFQSESKVGDNAERNVRNEARNECERATQRTCYAIAVTEMADVSGVGCTYRGKSNAFLGGSSESNEQRIALDKANREGFPASSCVEFFRY
jgi:hypothetical protein